MCQNPPMGLRYHEIRYLVRAAGMGVDFSTTLTLGRQYLLASSRVVQSAARDAGLEIPSHVIEEIEESAPYGDNLLRYLGATSLDALDVSDYQIATICQDLNEPIPKSLHNRFSLVIDGGTLEHVFNFPTALKSCMEMVAVGGHLLLATPTNNMSGHGFYQLSPEIFYRSLVPANGYELVDMVIVGGKMGRWYHFPDSQAIGDRVELLSHSDNSLMVLARRTEAVPIFETIPQQWDYTVDWTQPEEVTASALAPTGWRSLIQSGPLVTPKLAVRRMLDRSRSRLDSNVFTEIPPS